MRPLVNVASFGLVPVPSMLPAWSEHHRRSLAAGAHAIHGNREGERVATPAELAELELQLRQAQATADLED